jgi:hypothetical protein
MKTQNLSSEKNGISLAVTTKTGKSVYATPSALREILTNAPALLAELDSVDAAELAAIDTRANSTPEARKLARVTEQRAKLEAAVVAATTDGAKEVAVLSLKLFELTQK